MNFDPDLSENMAAHVNLGSHNLQIKINIHGASYIKVLTDVCCSSGQPSHLE